jgi:hypothetical protein
MYVIIYRRKFAKTWLAWCDLFATREEAVEFARDHMDRTETRVRYVDTAADGN